MAGTAMWIVVGLFLDGWAHNHLPSTLESFFTPWHGLLYSGVGAAMGVLVAGATRNRAAGYSWREALPSGYALSFLGGVLFAIGGVADMFWHMVFGIERSTEALVSPSHLWLAGSGVLLTTGPLRAAFRRDDTAPVTWRTILPGLLSTTVLFSVLTFFTQIAHPFVHPMSTVEATAPIEAGAEVHAMRADGSGQTRLTQLAGASAMQSSWSPDGRWIAFVSARDHEATLAVMDADGHGRRELATGIEDPSYPAWSPDGAKLAFVGRAASGRGNALFLVDALKSAEPVRLVAAASNPVAWSPDGRKIAFSALQGERLQIFTVENTGSGLQRLSDGSSDDVRPSWAPDGARLALSALRDGRWQVWTMNADGSGRTQLTSGERSNRRPAWSPDGRSIAFESAKRGGGWDVYVMSADGSNPANLTDSPGLDELLPSWSPDSRTLTYTVSPRATHTVELRTMLGVASMLLQSGLLVGFCLLLVRRWGTGLPFGSLALMFGLNAALLSVLDDRFVAIPAATAAGLVADVLARRLRPSIERPNALRFFAFAVPALYFAAFYVALMPTEGIGWSIHLWLGTVFMSGVAGLFLSFLVAPPQAKRAPHAPGR
jgi:Tol biopolymer transport system component